VWGRYRVRTCPHLYSPRMRVAFVGKGGAGKSTLSGTFARVLAATTTDRVLALDSDPMPGMAFALGVAGSEAGLPDDVVEPHAGQDGRTRYRLRVGLTGTDVVEAHAVRASDGVRFLQLGKARGPRWDNTRPHFAFQRVLDDLPGAGWSVVGDLPGGTRQPFMTWARWAEVVVVVVEPTPASLLTGRRLARLSSAGQGQRVLAVASKTRDPADGRTVAERTGLPLAGCVPFDPGLAEADRRGLAVLDADPDGPTATAVRSLVESLRRTEQG